MDYLNIAETLYKVVKHQVQWNNQDTKRIAKISRILQKELESKLAADDIVILKKKPAKSAPDKKSVNIVQPVLEAKPEETEIPVKLEEVKPEETDMTVTQPQSLMERIFMEQDAAMDKYTVVEPKKEDKHIEIDPNIIVHEKRYFVTFVCTSMSKKPMFQIFKGDDIVNTDFRTGLLIDKQCVYYAVIDADRNTIQTELNKYFVNLMVSNVVEQTADWIPPQYKNIWQNRTKIK